MTVQRSRITRRQRMGRERGRLLRRRGEIVRLGAFRRREGEELGDPASWALVIADILAATSADFDFPAMMVIAGQVGIEIPEEIAMDAVRRIADKRAEKGSEYRPIGAHAGALLRLTARERIRNDIRTMSAIDETASQRREWALQRRRGRDRAAKARQRRAKGVVTREEYIQNSISRQRPWVTLGISRSTYYRRLRRDSGNED